MRMFFYIYKMKTGLLLPLFYCSTFLQHDARFLCFYYLHSFQFFIKKKTLTCQMTSQRSCLHTLPMTFGGFSLIPSIRKLFLRDLSSRSINILGISSAHVGSVVCMMPMPSFVKLNSFCRFCTFSFMFKNL